MNFTLGTILIMSKRVTESISIQTEINMKAILLKVTRVAMEDTHLQIIKDSMREHGL